METCFGNTPEIHQGLWEITCAHGGGALSTTEYKQRSIKGLVFEGNKAGDKDENVSADQRHRCEVIADLETSHEADVSATNVLSNRATVKRMYTEVELNKAGEDTDYEILEEILLKSA